MRMLKYKCLLCGRVHYGRADLKPGYCTTAGIMERAADSIRDFTKVLGEVNRRR